MPTDNFIARLACTLYQSAVAAELDRSRPDWYPDYCEFAAEFLARLFADPSTADNFIHAERLNLPHQLEGQPHPYRG